MSQKKANQEAAEPLEALSFGGAMEELESILARIEAEEIDIDDLARELGRASRLIELARAKIKKAEIEVSQIVQGMDGAGAERSSE